MSQELILEPQDLERFLEKKPQALVTDVTTEESYFKHHIPGAIFFDYKNLVSGIVPAAGTLPDVSTLSHALAASGMSSDKPIIAYDDEGGGKASRLLWSLDILGFKKLYLINGGLHAWAQAGLGLEANSNPVQATEIESLHYNPDKIADKAFILNNLENDGVVIWDARTPEEYTGIKPRAARNGHIPGAINLNWLDTIDKQNGLRYLPKEQLSSLLQSKGITPDKTIVPHCQTHHRSAHSAILLKYLGYTDVRAYPGSWSEWGNATDTPIEQ